jgi:PKHD-type hydroxylase
MSYLYWKWDKQIPKEYCDIMLKNSRNKKFIEATLDPEKQILNKKRRNTDIFWVDPNSVVGCIADKYIRMANVSAGWDYELTNTESIQIGRYYHGGFYGWHSDDIATTNNPRKLSFTLLLNDPKEFEGGKFELKGLKEQPVLEQGSIIVFPSSLIHRVTPVTSGERYSAVTWMHGPNFK